MHVLHVLVGPPNRYRPSVLHYFSRLPREGGSGAACLTEELHKEDEALEVLVPLRFGVECTDSLHDFGQIVQLTFDEHFRAVLSGLGSTLDT